MIIIADYMDYEMTTISLDNLPPFTSRGCGTTFQTYF
jgi:hypothetical protein